mmetsp:Transcript_20007/g.53941  ORF Transcript_20007/g.53941 Transcript_20007/m.53941 type:complete len:206 (-) Transcript_20007:55-672(-)
MHGARVTPGDDLRTHMQARATSTHTCVKCSGKCMCGRSWCSLPLRQVLTHHQMGKHAHAANAGAKHAWEASSEVAARAFSLIPRGTLDIRLIRARHLRSTQLAGLLVACALELELLALRERPIPLSVDLRLVDEEVVGLTINVDKAKPLLVIEPFARPREDGVGILGQSGDGGAAARGRELWRHADIPSCGERQAAKEDDLHHRR